MTYDIATPDDTTVLDTWKWEEPRYLAAKKENKVVLRKDRNNKWQVEYKIYLYGTANDDEDESEERTKVPRSLLTAIEKNSDGKRQLREALGAENIFSNPKPIGLISHFLSFGTEKNSLILDFFAGSGTTAQAILEQNQRDGGSRQFILIQIPEKTEHPEYPTIADITRERVRRVIAKLDREDGNKKSDRGFRAYKLSSSNFRIWNAERTPDDPAKLAEQLQLYADNSGQARSEQDMLYELILKSGLPLSATVSSIKVASASAWSVDDSKLLILLNKSASREVLRAMITLQPQQMLCLDAAFNGDDALKTSIVLEARSHGVSFRTV